MQPTLKETLKKDWQQEKQLITLLNAPLPCYNLEVLSIDALKDITKLYQMYKGKDSFLYIPTQEEIKSTLASKTAWYIGAVTKTGKLIGLAKIEKLTLPSPFFTPPKNEQKTTAETSYYGLSGLIVHPDYRKNGCAKHLINTVTRSLKRLKAQGIYADCDYRNKASFATLSKTFHFIGFTDGRFGAPKEQSLYTTFYLPLREKAQQEKNGMTLDFTLTTPYKRELPNADNLSISFAILKETLQNIGSYTETIVPYDGGFNTLFILDTPIKTPKIKLKILDPQNEEKNMKISQIIQSLQQRNRP